MAFLSFPFTFTEVDEILDKEIEYEGDLTINTQTICTYNASRDNKSTIVRLANEDVYILPICLDCFEGILIETESIIDLSKVCTN
jgi:hypothetical protein